MILLQKEIIDKYLFYISHKFHGIFALMCESEHLVQVYLMSVCYGTSLKFLNEM
jgi:hypothetical protein